MLGGRGLLSEFMEGLNTKHSDSGGGGGGEEAQQYDTACM